MTFDPNTFGDPSKVIISLLKWLKDHIPDLATSAGLQILKQVGIKLIKRIRRKRQEQSVTALMHKYVTKEELREIMEALKTEIVEECKKNNLSIDEKTLLMEIYRGMISISHAIIIAFNMIYENRDNISALKGEIATVIRELEAQDNFISMLFDSDVEINSELERVKGEIREVKKKLEQLETSIIEQGEVTEQISAELQKLKDQVTSMPETIINEVWGRFLNLIKTQDIRYTLKKEISYFGKKLELIMLIQRRSGMKVYHYVPPTLGQASPILQRDKENAPDEQMIAGLMSAIVASAEDTLKSRICEQKTEKYLTLYAYREELLIVGIFKREVVWEAHIKTIFNTIAGEINKVVPSIPDKVFAPLDLEIRKKIDTIIEEYILDTTYDPKDIDGFKKNIRELIKVKWLGTPTTNSGAINVELTFIPKGIDKVELTIQEVRSRIYISRIYTITPNFLKFIGTSELQTTINRINNEELSYDEIILTIVARINNEEKIIGPFQKELVMEIPRPGKIRIVKLSHEELIYMGLDADNIILTDQLLRAQIQNIGDDIVSGNAKTFQIEVFQNKEDANKGSDQIYPSPIEVAYIIPEPINLPPKETREINIKFKITRELPPLNYLIIKISPKQDPGSYKLVKLILN